MSDGMPAGYRFAKSHEWARLDGDGRVVIGISEHAQSALGDLVFVELPAVGRTLAAQEACAVVESVKAASDVYAPIAGTVVAVNDQLGDAPETINQSPYGDGWMFAITPANPADLAQLLDGEAYAKIVAASH